MSLPRPAVIVADDDAALRYVCRLNLELEGHRVLEAATGERLRRLVDETSEATLLLDARLGREDGIRLGHELRRARPDIPIALVSGDTAATDPSAQALTNHVLRKPFALDDLIEMVRALAPR